MLFLGVYYSVDVSTSPLEGPHPIGSVLNLTCSTLPRPPDDATYQWTSSDPQSSITSPNTSLPFATAAIGPWHSKQGRYFCHVYSEGNTIAVGSTVITVQGNKPKFLLTFYIVCITMERGTQHTCSPFK